jgi:hypothetical protein
MKGLISSSFFALPLLTLSVVAQSPSAGPQRPLLAEVSEPCPSLNGQQAVNSNGAIVEVFCDSFFHPYNPSSVPGIANFASCAKICPEHDSCKGSIWSPRLRKCWTTSDENAARRTNNGFISLKLVGEAVAPISNDPNTEIVKEPTACCTEAETCKAEHQACVDARQSDQQTYAANETSYQGNYQACVDARQREQQICAANVASCQNNLQACVKAQQTCATNTASCQNDHQACIESRQREQKVCAANAASCKSATVKSEEDEKGMIRRRTDSRL